MTFSPRLPIHCLLVLIGGWSTSVALAQAGAPASVVVDAVRASQGLDSARMLSGHLHARRQMQVISSQAGRLEWIREAGETVAEGEVLARLDMQPLVLARDEQLARLRRSEVELKHTQLRLDRALQLDAQAFMSSNDMDALRERRELARADIAIARAQVAQLDDRIQRGTIRAPFAGVVTEQLRYAGEEVSSGSVLGALIGTQMLEVRAQIPLRWLRHLPAGTPIPVSASGQQGRAVVRSGIPAADTTTQTFELRADLADSGPWAVGQLVDLQLPELASTTDLLVPRDAVVLRREGARVVRIASDDIAHWVSVELGRGQGEWISVRGALAVGDRLAVRGAERLADQQPVRVLRDLAAEPPANPLGTG